MVSLDRQNIRASERNQLRMQIRNQLEKELESKMILGKQDTQLFTTDPLLFDSTPDNTKKEDLGGSSQGYNDS